ncbi:hypothetical protein [Kitasatospora sp. NPDC058218]|uniref:hypothetical protein n=1 Tax=Kitasatospora sp. NPDC058218 TaxID=3346385 RepID=UPI0036D77BF1
MFVFVCAGCGAELTAPLSEVALPVHAHQTYGNGIQLPVLMESGTFAVDPEPWGPPWRRWEQIDSDEAAARGVHAPVPALSDGEPGAIVIAPGDMRGTLLIPEKRGGACCGLAGGDGPNMVCEACALPVATRIDDCSLWQAVWLTPNAVDRLPVGGADTEPRSWKELMEEARGTPPYESIVTWGSGLGSSHHLSWSPQWEAAAGRALAHLLVASEGQPVTVPNGMVKEMFQRALDALLPTGRQVRRAVLAGPGLPVPDAGVDILLVPVHPQTGRSWTPTGLTAPAYPVPLPFGVWRWLVSPRSPLPVPGSGRVPDDVLREPVGRRLRAGSGWWPDFDDSFPLRPQYAFRADPRTFQHTLARLPAVRSPWLHEILDLTLDMRSRL